jgi:hypothetical protein
MKSLFVAGIILFIGSIILLFQNDDSLNVEKNGKLVKMKIEQLPKSCIGAKVRYFVTYSYEGAFYEKATRGDFCERHYVGELINMKFLKGSKTILMPNESVMIELISLGALALLGIGISISQWRKMQYFKD